MKKKYFVLLLLFQVLCMQASELFGADENPFSLDLSFFSDDDDELASLPDIQDTFLREVDIFLSGSPKHKDILDGARIRYRNADGSITLKPTETTEYVVVYKCINHIWKHVFDMKYTAVPTSKV